jgi:ATPases involved in chromosome partitioning
LSKKPDENDYSVGSDGEFEDLELDPQTGQFSMGQDEFESVDLDSQASVESDFFGDPEPAAMLTADRLLEEKAREKNRPEGFWQKLVYFLSFGLINLGDSKKVRQRKELDARIGASFGNEAKYVPVLTKKGGVGKTTVTTLIGMAMALVREDRVVAIDANPDRGTLAERVKRGTNKTVRDVVSKASSITSFTAFSDLV